MDENHHVIALNVGLPLVLICLVTVPNVGAQTVPCKADSIAIKDPVTGSVQCQDCLKCPAGEGLSVNCGDVIDRKTPLVCESCVLGETYSSAYEAGACKDCENCGVFRETSKECTLTSKAVCGKCMSGAYPEAMLAGMCKPCSPCCNDGNDIVVSECKVPGVPTNMQCSFARSEKCSKVIANTSVSTTASTLPTTESVSVPPELEAIPPTVATIPAHLEPAGKQLLNPTNSTSPANWVVIGSSIGVGFFALTILVLVILVIRYFKAKRKQACKDDTDSEMQRVPGNDEADEDEIEPNPEDALFENNQEVPLGVEETLDSPLPTGTQDTEPPGPHSSTGLKPVQEPRPELSCDKHSHTKIQKTTVKETTVCITCAPAKGCRCQLQE